MACGLTNFREFSFNNNITTVTVTITVAAISGNYRQKARDEGRRLRRGNNAYWD